MRGGLAVSSSVGLLPQIAEKLPGLALVQTRDAESYVLAVMHMRNWPQEYLKENISKTQEYLFANQNKWLDYVTGRVSQIGKIDA
jgi:hypothetical protein